MSLINARRFTQEMKILAFADTHGDTNLAHLEEPASQADLIVCAGDITDFSSGLEESLEALQALAEKTGKTIHLTHGNHEGSDVREVVAKYPGLRYVHEEVVRLPGVTLVTYGGGGFAQQNRELEEFFSKAHEQDFEDDLVVWMLHGPPYGLEVDELPWMGPVGSMSARAMIERFKPHIVVSGHIHEAWGVTHQHGRTLLVNPGPIGMLIEVQKEDS